jgi:hypothetical protein
MAFKGETVFVPPSSFTVKPHFPDKPERQSPEVLEFREWVRDGKEPYLWRLHTHTKPPLGAPIAYITDFQLPRAANGETRCTPCPCCTPTTAKFATGLLAWFPDEKVLRAVGPQCYRTLNPDGHNAAKAAYDLVRRIEADREFLLDNLTRVREAHSAIINNVPISQAYDEARSWILDSLQKLNVPLHQLARDGSLPLERIEDVAVQDRQGNVTVRQQSIRSSYGPLSGLPFFDASLPPLHDRMEAASRALGRALLRCNDIESMAPTERNAAVRAITRARSRAVELTELLQTWTTAVSPLNFSTISGWGRHADAPASLFIRFRGRQLFIGRTEASAEFRLMRPEFQFSVRPIPPLSV